jgi:hypothetical protein
MLPIKTEPQECRTPGPRSVRYPTYQLKAIAGLNRTSPETTLLVAVLETLHCLRLRFSGTRLPSGLDWPEASQHHRISLLDLESFSMDVGQPIRDGCHLSVIWLATEKAWALQLSEPDLGQQPGNSKLGCTPVPGRLFETHVAYRIVETQVACGFRTVVAEPPGLKTLCESYRMTLIRKLARNAWTGLSHGWPIVAAPHDLDTPAKIHLLAKWLDDRDRLMPVCLLIEGDLPPVERPVVPNLLDLLTRPQLALPSAAGESWEMTPEKALRSGYSLQADSLADRLAGYAQVFTLPQSQLPAFRRITGLAVAAGDVLIREPLIFGNATAHYHLPDILANHAIFDELIAQHLQNFTRGKAMPFSPVLFVPEMAKMK